MTKKRIVVTGMGVVSCFGNDVDAFYDALLAGKSGVSLIDSFPTDDYITKFAAQIKNFDPGEYIDKKQARRIDKFIAYALVAGKKALESSKISLDSINKHRAGILIGSGMGGMEQFSDGVETRLTSGPKRVSPFFVPYILTNMAGGLLGMDIGFMGPNYSISTACATGNNAIIAAAQHLERGDADLMICGGSEAAVIPMGIAGFNACKALSTRNDDPQGASRPWDESRDGFVMGEGAGVIVLETLEHAKARGATILAEYLGGGLSCDAYHITDPRPDGEGVKLCIENALKNANVTADQINYINAHATSTPVGDMAEINALKKVFSNREKISMNATKSMIGHALGAAGGLEAIATLMAIIRKKVHPTINLKNRSEGIDFHLPTQAEDLDIQVAISNSFGFGGHNATVVFAPYR
jgi:3-oxoacyl-[acyl-carrier-protein] synthase II